MSVIGVPAQTALTRRPSVSADRQRQGINRLHRISGLPARLDQALLQARLELPEVGRLAHEQRPITQFRKEVLIMTPKVVVEVRILSQFPVFATDFHRDDFSVGQFWRKAASSQRSSGSERIQVRNYQTVNGDDKSIAIH